MAEIATLLSDVIGQKFTLETKSPKEFRELVVRDGFEHIESNAYMNCVYNQFEQNVANAIPEADTTFDNFKQITGTRPTSWKDFIQRNKSVILSQLKN